jgi:hypothetical protein
MNDKNNNDMYNNYYNNHQQKKEELASVQSQKEKLQNENPEKCKS